MIKNRAIINEIEDRNKQSFAVNYEDMYADLSANIHEEFYTLDYQHYLQLICRNFDIIPSTENFPSTLEVAFDLYVVKNSENNHTANLNHPDFKGFLAELENFDDLFYEVVYDHNKMYRTIGSGKYEFVITLNDTETTEAMLAFIKEIFAGYAYEIINVSDDVAVIHVEVDGEAILFADIEILLYSTLKDGKLGTYTYEAIS